MAGQTIGSVRTGKTGKTCDVSWHSTSGEVYVAYAGWTKCPKKAYSARDAMQVAEAFLYDK
jgi:hypothetical protein